LLRPQSPGRRAIAGHARPLAPEPAFPDPDLAAALASLRDEEREALLLLAWAELSYEEIATATGVAIGTVRSRLSRARAKPRKLADAQLLGEKREPTRTNRQITARIPSSAHRA